MKKVTLFICAVIISSLTNAQQLISTTGGFFQSSQQSLSFSIGEVLTNCYTVGPATLSQGMHQPTIQFATSIKGNGLELSDIKVFPNPALEQCYLDFGAKLPKGLNFQLIGSTGVLVKRGNLLQSSTMLSLSGLSPDIYLLLISDQHNRTIQEFKIVKL